jgi:uncharacterized protein YodC (DUF2158 family)
VYRRQRIQGVYNGLDKTRFSPGSYYRRTIMADAFKVGDVVQLKSGGPQMTVKFLDGDDVICMWFDGKRTLDERFPAETLAKYDPGSPVTLLRG